MKQKRVSNIDVDSGVIAQSGVPIGVKGLKTHYKIEAFRPINGELVSLWTEEFDNLVVDAGLNDSLDKHLKGSGYTAAWYIGLTDADPTFDPADTMDGAHAGWSELTDYDEVVRQTLVLGAVSGKSVDNSGNKAVFTIDATATFGGAFVVDEDTPGGATGILYGGGVFTQNRALIDNDVLNVTITCTAAAS
jgi:hypothetical protein